MTKRIILSSLIALTLFACSGDREDLITTNSDLEQSSSSISAIAIHKEKIYGVAQKGPFVNGATVNIYELDSKYEKTKKSFSGKTNGKGYFEIEVGKLASPYVMAFLPCLMVVRLALLAVSKLIL